MHLNQSLREVHLSALVASSSISLVAAVYRERESGANTPRKMFCSVHYTLASNASLSIMLAISSKDLKFCYICFFIRGTLKDGLEDIPIYYIYHLQSQFEPRSFYSKAISLVLM